MLAAVAALLLGGCTAAADDPQVMEPSLGPIAVLDSAADIRLPLDAYQLTYDEWSAMVLAETRLTRDCAARFGVDYTIAADQVLASAVPEDTFDANKNRYSYRFYLNDKAAAREYGYQVPLGVPQTLIGDVDAAWVAKDVFTQVVLSGLEPGPTPPDLGGSSGRAEAGPGAYPTGYERPVDSDGDPLPEGGCGGEAVGVLAGEGGIHNPFYANEVSSEAYFRALEDSRVVAVTREWSECMAERGYEYANPGAPFGDPAWRDADESTRPLPEEVATAVADVECKESVNYLGVRVAVESAYQERTIEEHFQDLELNYRNAQEMLRRANESAAGGGA